MTPAPRVSLRDSIPLKSPFTIYIEPTNVCNFKCHFCPESFVDFKTKTDYYGQMQVWLLDKVVNNIKDFPEQPKVIRPFLMGEPFLSRDILVLLGKVRPLCGRLEITTNGSILNSITAQFLTNLPLNLIRVSVYGTTNTIYQEQTGQSYHTIEKILNNIKTLKMIRSKRMLPLIQAELVTTVPNQESRFLEQWSEIADYCTIKTIHNWGANLVQLGTRDQSKRCCPFPFYEMFIKANGDVTVCTADWDGKLKVGSLLTHSLVEIWNSPKLRWLQETHLNGLRNQIPQCAECNVIYCGPDDLD